MLNAISFKGKPDNYKKIDNTVSRSAQPKAEDFKWLKEQGVTDVINFRTMYVSGIGFDEKSLVEQNGMKYHNIPSHTKTPNEQNIGKFLDIVDNVQKQGGKVHIHCKAGRQCTEQPGRNGIDALHPEVHCGGSAYSGFDARHPRNQTGYPGSGRQFRHAHCRRVPYQSGQSRLCGRCTRGEEGESESSG